jgi:hypothetical protein
MKKSLFTALFFFYFFWGFSQMPRPNLKIYDPKAKQDILIGYCTRDGLVSSNFSAFYKEGYEKYDPDTALLKKIVPKLRQVVITLVMGTWCSDSQEQVPRFYKILDQAGYKDDVTIFCVNKDKRAGPASIDALKIEKVPTFIFYRNTTELGRIIETPSGTLEQDILAIVSKD